MRLPPEIRRLIVSFPIFPVGMGWADTGGVASLGPPGASAAEVTTAAPTVAMRDWERKSRRFRFWFIL
jgi:hypothetical protein